VLHWLVFSKLGNYSIRQRVRDVLYIIGFLVLDASGAISQIVLNRAAPLAAAYTIRCWPLWLEHVLLLLWTKFG
jgi:hypothetical protein